MNSSGINKSLFSVYKRKFQKKLFGTITLKPASPNGKRALLSYVTHPFVITEKELVSSPHTNPHECLVFAEILLENGYTVDVIEWTNTTFIPKKRYDVLIDIHQNIERLNSLLPTSCVKVFYITGAHWKFQNDAENKRLTELEKRRGVKLVAQRQVPPTKNIENADFAIALGSHFAKDTYAFAHKEIEQVPLLSNTSFDSPENKNFENCRKKFVWIGGGGAVHKGLDVVLEAFKELPDYSLTICGPVGAEKDFVDLYKKELFETPSIKTVGRINIASEEFKNIVNNSLALVYPSCSEGQSGSVITALHAGLIPLVSFESGVDVTSFGEIMSEHSPEYIRKQVIALSQKPIDELKKEALTAWNYARNHHTRAIYKKSIEDILKKRNII